MTLKCWVMNVCKIHLKMFSSVFFSNHSVCCNPLTFRWFYKGLAWNQTRHGHLLADDDEPNTKLSIELGEIRQRINSTFVIVRAQISRMETECFTTPSQQT